MSNHFISLSNCPEISGSDLLDSDYLIASVKDNDGISVFRKLSISDLKSYLNFNYMDKLGLNRTFSPYLFQVYYDNYDYDYGIDELEVYRNASSILNDLPIEYSSAYPAGCASVHLGLKCGHNYDCKFDELASFIVRTPLATNLVGDNVVVNRHATLSLSSRIRRLTKDFVNSKVYDKNYNLIPFYVVDGINDAGLCVTVNSLKSGQDAGFSGAIDYHTTGTNPSGIDVCALMLARIFLDKCSNIDECINELNNWNVWCPCIYPWSSEFHWTITDSTGRVVCLEIIDNEFKVIEMGRGGALPNISTNFYLWNYDGNINNICIQYVTESNPMNATLTEYSNGLERYKIITDSCNNLENAPSITDIFNILKLVNYTNIYDQDANLKWYSDYCNNWGDPYGDLTINSSIEDYTPIYNNGINNYDSQKLTPIRLGLTKFTSNSVVYDLEDKVMYIKCQEFDKVMEFKL